MPLSRLTLIAAIALTLLPACRTKQISSAVDGSADTLTPETGGPDTPAGARAAGDALLPPASDGGPDVSSIPTIGITSPAAATTFTNGPVTFQVAVTGRVPVPSIDLVLADDTILASTQPPFRFTWDTTLESEGTYTVAARATTSSGVTVTSLPVTIVVDRTPPTIVSQTPLPGSANVAVADPIAITFSEPLAGASPGPTAINLSAGNTPLPATSTLSKDGATISVALTVPPALSLPASITATFGTSITDRAGNPLVPTGDWTWTLPLWVDLGDVPGTFPSLVIDPTDHPYLATTDEQIPGTFVYTLHVNHLAADNTWSELLSPAVGTVDQISSIALDATGAPLVAWSQGHVYLARWLGSALAPWDLSYGTVDDIATFTARSPTLAVDSTNNPTIAWAYPNGHVDLDYAARWNPTTLSWQRLFSDPNTPIAAGTPALRLDAGGSPLVLGFNTGAGSVSHFTSAGWQPVDTTSPASYAPDALVTDARPDAAARPTIVLPSASASKIRVTSLTGSSWQDFGPIITTGQGVADARLIFGGPTPIVLWTEAGQKIRLARLLQNAWNYSAGAIASVSGASGSITSPVLALDSKGHVVVAWSEITADQRSTFVRKSNR